MKVKVVVRMTKQALDQFARVVLERDGHHWCKLKGDGDRSREAKSTGEAKNWRRSHEACDYGDPSESV